MRFLTDRKQRAAAHSGSGHHRYMQLSAVGLTLTVPVFLFIFGGALGSPHADALAIFSRPVPVIVTALVLVVGMQHFHKGMQTVFEDYTKNPTRKALIMITTLLSYGLTAVGLFALAKIVF